MSADSQNELRLCLRSWISIWYDLFDVILILGNVHLFVTTLKSFPDNATSTITFSSALPTDTVGYHYVVGLNSFYFLETNTIAWNFTKLDQTLTSFALFYEIGIESVIYTLKINYMVLAQSYPDYDIAYFNHTCSVMNTSSGWRSENLTYTTTKLTNSSNIEFTAVLESFNITNTQVGFIVLQKEFFIENFTITMRFITTGLSIVREIQCYLFLHDRAYQDKYYLRITDLQSANFNNGTANSNIDSNIESSYKFANMFFYGVSGFNFTKIGRKSLHLTFFDDLAFDYQVESLENGTIDSIDVGIFLLNLRQCTNGYHAGNSLGCVPSCPVVGLYLHVRSKSCQPCHYSCALCKTSQESDCSTCDASRYPVLNRIEDGTSFYTCPCTSDKFDLGISTCATCSSSMDACASCSDNITCTSCLSNFFLTSGAKCVCSDQTFTYFSGSCSARVIGCQNHFQEGGVLNCSECYVQRGFTLTSAMGCECIDAKTHIESVSFGEYYCNFTCGDGYVSSDQECDDSNPVNNDGCSSTCAVQVNHVCTGALAVTSVCQYNLITNLTFISSERLSYSNQMLLNLSLYSYVWYFDSVNFTSYTETSFPDSAISDTYFNCPSDTADLTCNLTYLITYSADLETQTSYTMHLNLQSAHSKFKYNSSTLSVNLAGQRVQLSFESQESLSNLETMQIVSLALVLCSFIVAFGSLFVEKMIGIELITSIQFMYFTISAMKTTPIELSPVVKSLRYSNGFNQIYPYDYYRYSPLPNNLNHIYFQKEFLLNVNVSLLIFLTIILVLVFIKVLMKCTTSKQIQEGKDTMFEQEESSFECSLDMVYIHFFNKCFVFYALILLNQVLFALVMATLDEVPSEVMFDEAFNFIACIVAFTLVFAVVVAIFYWYCQESNDDTQSIRLELNPMLPFEFSLFKKRYILAFVSVQILKILILAFLFEEQFCLYVFIGISAIYFIGLIIYRPYEDKESGLMAKEEQDGEANVCISIHNFGICFNELIVIWFAVMCLIWNIVINNYDHANTKDFTMILLQYGLGSILLLNIVAVLRILYKKLGFLACCSTNCCDKESNDIDCSSDAAFKNMRKIVRDADLNKYMQEENIEGNNDHAQSHSSRKMKNKGSKKILKEIRNNKNYFINWRNESSNSNGNSECSSDSQKEESKESNSNDEDEQEEEKKVGKEKNEDKKATTNNTFELREFSRKKVQNAGFKISKAAKWKSAELNHSFIDKFLDKKYLENSHLYQPKTIFEEQEEEMESADKGEDNEETNLEDFKERLRVEFQQKQQSEKEK